MSMTFGERVREIRKAQGISQRDLAAIVKVDFTYISKIETGDTPPPSRETIHRIAWALNADEGELFALAGKVSAEVLAQRLTELEEKQAGLVDELEEVRQLVNQLRNKQGKDGTYQARLDHVDECMDILFTSINLIVPKEALSGPAGLLSQMQIKEAVKEDYRKLSEAIRALRGESEDQP